jgi:hypothetical protein
MKKIDRYTLEIELTINEVMDLISAGSSQPG